MPIYKDEINKASVQNINAAARKIVEARNHLFQAFEREALAAEENSEFLKWNTVFENISKELLVRAASRELPIEPGPWIFQERS